MSETLKTGYVIAKT